MRDQLPIRILTTCVGVRIAFASLILSVTFPAHAQDGEEDTEDFQPPELLYLTWQEENPRDPAGKHFPVWKPDGKRLSDEAAKKLRKQVKDFAVFNSTEEQLHPLILIFKVDARAEASPVMPTLLNEAGTSVGRGGSENKPHDGLILSNLSPSQSDLLLWPETATIEVRYPVENPTVLKTVEGPPEGLIEIAKGVTWKLDPNYAMQRDPETRRLVRAENKFAGVLATDLNEADPNVDYEVRIEVGGGTLLKNYLHTAKSNPVGKASRLDISEPVDNPQQISKLFIVRQRHATKTFKDFSIKRDLLFEAQRNNESDE